METWYFGEPEALAQAYGKPAAAFVGKSEYRAPDAIPSPAATLQKAVPAFQKTSGARRMGELLAPERNCSKSFKAFLDGVRALVAAAAATPEGTD